MGHVFLHVSGSATRIELLRQLAQQDTCVIFAAAGSFDDLAHQRNCRLCKRPSVPACRLFPPLVQVRPAFIPSSSATLFLYRRPGIGSISLQRETVHEQEAREGAREASLQRMDLAEERVGFYEDAI
jgi:hypothetical protein